MVVDPMDKPVKSAVTEINRESNPSGKKYLGRRVMRHPAADPILSTGNKAIITIEKPGGRRVCHIIKPGTNDMEISKESNPTMNNLLRRMLCNPASKPI